MDAALKLHEEELAVYESLGDRRSRAVTLGDIARIQADKGEVDAALKRHEERLAVFEALGDRRSRAVTLHDLAGLHLARQDYGAAKSALSRAWADALYLQQPDGLAYNGILLGQLLLRDNEHEAAAEVLGLAARAWRVLGGFKQALFCEQLRRFALGEGPPPGA